MKNSIVVAAVATASMALAWGCSTSEDRLGVEVDNRPPTSFVTEDAAVAAEGGLVTYCPSNNCPPGWTTCPNSRFPCDVNLSTDVDNCGACGAACPSGGATGDTFSCFEGACTLQCGASPKRLDCDGLADNACEIEAIDNDNCGTCGKKCTDPVANGCAYQGAYAQSAVDCGCTGGKTYCQGGFCNDLKNDDYNCGECWNTCDPTGGGAPARANARYGCADGKCGAAKCDALFGNCDNAIENGCETSLVTAANCGACGFACPDGQACRIDGDTQQPTCMCPAGLTYCQTSCNGDICTGKCVDTTSDIGNCGACGASCPYVDSASRTCSFGTCVMRCADGQADCNNSASDGCEVSTNSDPRNCGGCGITCDAIAGQACVAGRCVVEPCTTDAGVTTR